MPVRILRPPEDGRSSPPAAFAAQEAVIYNIDSKFLQQIVTGDGITG
jgi:hypothetical protein